METADAGCSLSGYSLCSQVAGTRTYVSTDCCFFIVGQKDCHRKMDCQALFPALTGEHVRLFFF